MSATWEVLSVEPIGKEGRIYTQIHRVMNSGAITLGKEQPSREKITSAGDLVQLVTAVMVELGDKATIHTLRAAIELIPRVQDTVVNRIHKNVNKEKAFIYMAIVCDFTNIAILPFLQSIDPSIEEGQINHNMIQLVLGSPSKEEAQHMDPEVVESLGFVNNGFQSLADLDLLAFYAVGVHSGFSSSVAQYVVNLVASGEPARAELKKRPVKVVLKETEAATDFVGKTNTHIFALKATLPNLHTFKKSIT